MKLNNTTLATITWNSVQNSAGGIKRYVDSHAPFVDKVLIYDTGSTDGTLDVLNDLRKQHSNLEILAEKEFKGFSIERNKLIQQCKTPWILMLDDDELLTSTDFDNILENFNPRELAYSFNWRTHFTDREDDLSENMFPKLFKKTGLRPEFKGNVFEELYFGEMYWKKIPEIIKIPKIEIKHFSGSKKGYEQKMNELYNPMRQEYNFFGKKKIKRPNTFTAWKEYDPKRDDYN
ncbi:glycosyltransferase [Candidatus Woesearchaeota archaeon]|nr:glycosyltransferase [Candidatus Woesearchaeota archaeon]